MIFFINDQIVVQIYEKSIFTLTLCNSFLLLFSYHSFFRICFGIKDERIAKLSVCFVARNQCALYMNLHNHYLFFLEWRDEEQLMMSLLIAFTIIITIIIITATKKQHTLWIVQLDTVVGPETINISYSDNANDGWSAA